MSSFLEGILNETPMIAIPFFSDQFYISKIIQDKNLGMSRNLKTLNEKTIKQDIETTIQNHQTHMQAMKPLKKSLLAVDTGEVLEKHIK